MKRLRRHMCETLFYEAHRKVSSLKAKCAVWRDNDGDKEAFTELENYCDEALDALDGAIKLLKYVEVEDDYP